MLIKLGIKYGSKKSIELCDQIGFVMANNAINTSCNLAIENGKTYPNYKDIVTNSEFLTSNSILGVRNKVKLHGLYNSQLLTTAPTGTLSTMLGVSGGIEPVYANYYTRKTESLHGHDEYYKVYTPIVKKYMDEHNLKDDSELPEYFITSQQIDFRERINMQSVWQKHIDASISSTINLPNSATVHDVEELYMYAWQKGLKGVTIFRDGCKRVGVLSTENAEIDKNPDVSTNGNMNNLPRGYILKVDDNTIGKERHLTTGCGTLHMCSYFDPDTGDLLEDYINKGSQGGCFANLIGLSRMISLAARLGGDVKEIADQLLSVPACPSYVARRVTKHDTSKGACCPNAIGYALLDMCNEMKDDIGLCDEDVSDEQNDNTILNKEHNASHAGDYLFECPECGGELVSEGGCVLCHSCGWSKCD